MKNDAGFLNQVHVRRSGTGSYCLGGENGILLVRVDRNFVRSVCCCVRGAGYLYRVERTRRFRRIKTTGILAGADQAAYGNAKGKKGNNYRQIKTVVFRGDFIGALDPKFVGGDILAGKIIDDAGIIFSAFSGKKLLLTELFYEAFVFKRVNSDLKGVVAYM